MTQSDRAGSRTLGRATWLRDLLALALILAATGAWAQEGTEEEKKVLEPGKWYPSLEGGIQLTQSSYSDNWSGGDKGSMVWAAIVQGQLENQLRPWVNSRSVLKLAFGQTHQQRANASGKRHWEQPDKSSDLIDFETIARFTLGGFVDPFLGFRLESQFLDATDPLGREIAFNPVKYKESAGVARQILRTENRDLLSRFGFTFRQSSRKYFIEATSDRKRSDTTNDGGLEWTTEYKDKKLTERISWSSKATLYKPVFYSGDDEFDKLSDAVLQGAGLDTDLGDFPKAIDA